MRNVHRLFVILNRLSTKIKYENNKKGNKTEYQQKKIVELEKNAKDRHIINRFSKRY